MLAAINYDLWIAIGAVLSGAGSVIMGMVALRMAKSHEAPKPSDVDDGGRAEPRGRSGGGDSGGDHE